jgi:hypothetical protein
MTRNIRKTRTPAPNSGLAKVPVQCFETTLVVNQSMILRFNLETSGW